MCNTDLFQQTSLFDYYASEFFFQDHIIITRISLAEKPTVWLHDHKRKFRSYTAAACLCTCTNLASLHSVFFHPKNQLFYWKNLPVKLKSSPSHHGSISVWGRNTPMGLRASEESWSTCVYVSASVLHDPWCHISSTMDRLPQSHDVTHFSMHRQQFIWSNASTANTLQAGHPCYNTPFLFRHPSQPSRIWEEEILHLGCLLQPQELPLVFEICNFLELWCCDVCTEHRLSQDPCITSIPHQTNCDATYWNLTLFKWCKCR